MMTGTSFRALFYAIKKLKTNSRFNFEMQMGTQQKKQYVPLLCLDPLINEKNTL